MPARPKLIPPTYSAAYVDGILNDAASAVLDCTDTTGHFLNALEQGDLSAELLIINKDYRQLLEQAAEAVRLRDLLDQAVGYADGLCKEIKELRVFAGLSSMILEEQAHLAS